MTRKMSEYIRQSAMAVLLMEELKKDMRAAGYVNTIHDEWELPARPSFLSRAKSWLTLRAL